MHRAAALSTLAVVLAGALAYLAFYQEPVDPAKASWRFSTTQEWDPGLYAKTQEAYIYPLDFDAIELPPYPDNLSTETRNELAHLANLSYRTPETLEAIQKEIKATGIQMGSSTLFGYFNPIMFPKTSVVMGDAYHDLFILIMRKKALYDRVRPSFLREDIAPTIPIPPHPAYPSGHSTELHFLAFILSELDPENTDMYVTRAAEVARHREIAGVHYPSDSKAGAILAREFVDLLLTDPTFQARLEEAKEEWR